MDFNFKTSNLFFFSSGCAMIWPKKSKIVRQENDEFEITSLTFDAFGQKFQLSLTPSRSMFSKDFVFIKHG